MKLSGKNNRMHLVTLLFVLCVLTIAVVGIAKLSGAGGTKPTGGTPTAPSEPQTVDGPLPGFSENEEPVPENVFLYRINSKPFYKTGISAGDVMIENPTGNSFDMQVDFELDSMEVIYSSEVIKPGNHIAEAVLVTAMPAGEYSVSARIYAIDPDTQKVVDVITERITVTIGKE